MPQALTHEKPATHRSEWEHRQREPSRNREEGRCPGSLKNSREDEEADLWGELHQMMEGWVDSICHRALSRGGLRSCASYFTILSLWLNCTSVFCFFLFLFAMWCHLGHPCLSTLQETTWCHTQSCHPQPSYHLQGRNLGEEPFGSFWGPLLPTTRASLSVTGQ